VAHIPSTDELADILATMLAGAIGGDKAVWVKAIGPVEVLPILFNVQSNWAITSKGTKKQREYIDAAVNIVRGEHPYVKVPGAIESSNISRLEMRR
jgi:hypothetical protein